MSRVSCPTLVASVESPLLLFPPSCTEVPRVSCPTLVEALSECCCCGCECCCCVCVFSSTLPWAFSSSARTRTSCSLFKLSLQLFCHVLLLWLRRDPKSHTTSETSFHFHWDSVSTNPARFGLLRTQENDSTLISFAILLTATSLLISTSSEVTGMATTTATLILQLQQMALPNSAILRCLSGPKVPFRCHCLHCPATDQVDHRAANPPFLFRGSNFFLACLPKLFSLP